MKTSILLGAVLAGRLALAGAAGAQEAATRAPVPPRLEIGGTVGTTWFTPSVGLLVSAPAWARTSVEGGANLTPRDRFVQGQLRVLFRAGPGARRSLVVGLTHLSRRGGAVGVIQPGLAAHAGLTAQAPINGRFDVRADAQIMSPLHGGAGADLRGVVAVVWHR